MARKPILNLLLVLCLTFFAAFSLIWLLFPAHARDEALISANPEKAGLHQQNDVPGDYLLGVGKADITGYISFSFEGAEPQLTLQGLLLRST
jgi:hypothetical protein